MKFLIDYLFFVTFQRSLKEEDSTQENGKLKSDVDRGRLYFEKKNISLNPTGKSLEKISYAFPKNPKNP